MAGDDRPWAHLPLHPAFGAINRLCKPSWRPEARNASNGIAGFCSLRPPVRRLAFPPTPLPASPISVRPYFASVFVYSAPASLRSIAVAAVRNGRCHTLCERGRATGEASGAQQTLPLRAPAPRQGRCAHAPLQESILSEKSLSGLSLASSQDLSDGPLDHFPCIAEELEQQAKQLEEDWCAGATAATFRRLPPRADSWGRHAWAARGPALNCPAPTHPHCSRFCPSQPPVALAAQAKAQQSFRLNAAVLGPPALRHSALDLLQRQLALQEEEEQRRLQEQVVKQQERRQQQQAAECRARECTPTPTAAEAAAAPCTREEPCTPQRHSAGDSSWSESPLPGNLEDYAEVQSPGGCWRAGCWAGRWAHQAGAPVQQYNQPAQQPAHLLYRRHSLGPPPLNCSHKGLPSPPHLVCIHTAPAAPVKMMALISPAGPSPACPAFGSTEHPQLPPLAAAIHNAQRVRLGQEPDPGAWRGCGRCVAAPFAQGWAGQSRGA